MIESEARDGKGFIALRNVTGRWVRRGWWQAMMFAGLKFAIARRRLTTNGYIKEDVDRDQPVGDLGVWLFPGPSSSSI